MTARELRRWAALDDRRRRRAGAGLAALPRAVLAFAVGVVVATWVVLGVKRGGEVGGARLIGAATVAYALVLCGAPFRQFWRRDSPLLARLPLSGRALFGLAFARSLAVTALASLAIAPGLVVLVALAPELAGRYALLVVALAALGGLAGPAVALAAGAVVASDRARAALASLGGELSAPPTVWLGALPAFAASALVLLAIDLAPWAAGGDPAVGDPRGLIAIAFGGSAALVVWAHAIADRAMPGALREVAALDRERLAHVDRSTPSALERAVARRLGAGAARVFDKDARLARRRFPSPYALGPLGVVIAWLLYFGGDGARAWSLVLVGGLGAYAALMARRGQAPPIELRRLSLTLPLRRREVARAKRVAAALRTVTWVGLAGVPLAIRWLDPLVIGWIALAALAPLLAAGGGPRPANQAD